MLDKLGDGAAIIFLMTVLFIIYCILCPPAQAATIDFVCAERSELKLLAGACLIAGGLIVLFMWTVRDAAEHIVERFRRG